jgi:hypothetical protein
MTFTESNTVERMILDAVTKVGGKWALTVRDDSPRYGGALLDDELRLARWDYLPAAQLPHHLGYPCSDGRWCDVKEVPC